MPNYTQPTTHFWQVIRTAAELDQPPHPPYRYRYPAQLPDERFLELPLRSLPDAPEQAVASFIANHAAFSVIETLSDFMADLTRSYQPEVIVGLPTLGLVFAPHLARRLGFANYVPLGYSRKYWYDDALSIPVRSITTPGAGKSLYLDPNVLPRLQGRRVVVVDDAISTGQTTQAALHLIAAAGAEPVALVVAMRQGHGWREKLATLAPHWPERVHGVFDSPQFQLETQGWIPLKHDSRCQE